MSKTRTTRPGRPTTRSGPWLAAVTLALGACQPLPAEPEPEAETEAEVTGLGITPAEVDVAEGEQVTFTVEATYSDGQTSDVTAETDWSLSNPAVARQVIGPVGTFEGAALGEATLTAEFGGQTADATFRVLDPVVTSESTYALGVPWTGDVHLFRVSRDDLENPTDLGTTSTGFSFTGLDLLFGGDSLGGVSPVGFPVQYEWWKQDLGAMPIAETDREVVDGVDDIRQVVATREREIVLRGPSHLRIIDRDGDGVTTPLDLVPSTAMDVVPTDELHESRLFLAGGGPSPELISALRNPASNTLIEIPGTRVPLLALATELIARATIVVLFGYEGLEAFSADGLNTRIGGGWLTTDPARFGTVLDDGSGIVTALWASDLQDDRMGCLSIDVGVGTVTLGPSLDVGETIEDMESTEDGHFVGVLTSDGADSNLEWYELTGECELTERATIAVPLSTELVLR